MEVENDPLEDHVPRQTGGAIHFHVSSRESRSKSPRQKRPRTRPLGWAHEVIYQKAEDRSMGAVYFDAQWKIGLHGFSETDSVAD